MSFPKETWGTFSLTPNTDLISTNWYNTWFINLFPHFLRVEIAKFTHNYDFWLGTPSYTYQSQNGSLYNVYQDNVIPTIPFETFQFFATGGTIMELKSLFKTFKTFVASSKEFKLLKKIQTFRSSFSLKMEHILSNLSTSLDLARENLHFFKLANNPKQFKIYLEELDKTFYQAFKAAKDINEKKKLQEVFYKTRTKLDAYWFKYHSLTKESYHNLLLEFEADISFWSKEYNRKMEHFNIKMDHYQQLEDATLKIIEVSLIPLRNFLKIFHQKISQLLLKITSFLQEVLHTLYKWVPSLESVLSPLLTPFTNELNLVWLSKIVKLGFLGLSNLFGFLLFNNFYAVSVIKLK